jgi:hypothetical protein
MRTFIFNHIERCAGTSLRINFFQEFSKLCDPKDIYISDVNYPSTANIEFNQNVNLSDLRNKKVFADHSSYLAIEQILGLDRHNVYRTTSMRSPYERFVSHVSFFKLPTPHPSPKSLNTRLLIENTIYDLDKPKDLEIIINTIGHLQIAKLQPYPSRNELSLADKLEVAIASLASYQYIFICDEFSKSISAFNRINPFNLKLDNVKINVGNVQTDLFDESTKKYIKERLVLEYKLYDVAYQRFKNLFA